MIDYKTLLARRDARIKELEILLEVSVCPQCDGSGAYYDGEVRQCRFCDERKSLLEGGE